MNGVKAFIREWHAEDLRKQKTAGQAAGMNHKKYAIAVNFVQVLLPWPIF